MELAKARRPWAGLYSFFKVLLAATLGELAVFTALIIAHAALSYSSLEFLAGFLGLAVTMSAVIALCSGAAYVYFAIPKYRLPLIFCILLTGSTLGAHLYVINNPSLPACVDTSKGVNGCVMDESYYVPSAEDFYNGTQCGPGIANCNPEHPFLSKALMAAGIWAFGDNTTGWRIFDVLLGSFSLPLLFLITLRLTGSRKASYLSAALLGLDVMFFSQSSAALLDIPLVFFSLLAFVLYLYKVRLWLLDRFTLAGICLGLATLSKETGIFLIATLATYHFLVGEGGRTYRSLTSIELALVSVGVFILGLQTYDSLLARAAFPTFLSQIQYMLHYGASLIGGGWTYGNNIQITPFSWVTYYQPVTYFGSTVIVNNVVNGTVVGILYTYPDVTYYGVTNFIETWTVYLWVPLAAVAMWAVFKPKPPGLDRFGFADNSPREFSGDTKMAVLSLVWLCWNYLPYVALYLAGRVTYPFYFVPALPAVAMGGSYFLTRSWVPKFAVVLYLVGAFVFFFWFFPSKAFLPVWLRVLIGK